MDPCCFDGRHEPGCECEGPAGPDDTTVLSHGRNCPAATPLSDDDCTCGLEWRIKLTAEQAMHAAWRKRAEEAEAVLASKSADRKGIPPGDGHPGVRRTP